GVYNLTLKATNPSGFSTQAFVLTVNELPKITSANHATLVIGSSGSFSVTTTAGYPTATSLSETGALPSGVSFTDNTDGTATLGGTPAAGTAGSYPLTIKATNSTGTTQQAFTLTVQPANQSPVITSADHATFVVGTAGSFTVTTTAGFPTSTTITETGALPAGVTFTDNHDGTATLAGTATASGVYPLTIKASNGATTDAQQSFTLTVNKPPVITSGNTANFTSGLAGSFTVTTLAGFPTSTTLTETGALPAGVTFTDNHNGTATIAGTATVTATTSYPIVIKASNGISPDASQNFTLKVTKVATVDLPTNAPAFTGPLQGVPVKVIVGQVLTVSGSGYTPGAPITIGWYTPRTVLGRTMADSAGKFSITIVVGAKTGSKTVIAAGLGANGKARYLGAYTVVNPKTSSTSGGAVAQPIVGGSGYESGLANTGLRTDRRASAASAGALALTGFALMMFGRRRRDDN
ncbi:MAG: hypothetical protein QOI26_2402, partial [Pseudonocardiales bacterium]|nr:hypothetical protein [Pseudonocardiales bacterium]